MGADGVEASGKSGSLILSQCIAEGPVGDEAVPPANQAQGLHVLIFCQLM